LGASPSRILVKAWKTSAQPASWSVDATDSETGLQDAGFVGLRGDVAASVTNATSASPLKVQVDNLAGLSGSDATAPTVPTVQGGGSAWGSYASLVPRASGSTDSGGSGFAFYQSRTSRDAGSTWTAPIVGTTRTIREEGETLVQFRRVDWAGNTSAWAPSSGSSGTVRLDRTAPTGMVVSGGSASWSNAASIVVAAGGASDPLSGLATFAYQRRTSVNGGATWSSASSGASQTVTAVGETLVQFRVLDKANNYSSWRPVAASPEATVRIDRTAPGAPTVSSSSHADPGTAYASTTLVASWTAPSDTSGVGGYGVVVDATATTVPGVVTQVEQTLEAPNQTVGTRYLHVRAQDGAGNWGTTSHFAFTVSGSFGGVELLEPVDAVETNGVVRLSARAPGSSGIRFEFRRSDDMAWSIVPNARLTTESGAAATLPVSPGAGSVTPVLLWDAGATTAADSGVGDNALDVEDGPFDVRAVDIATSTASPGRLVRIDRVPPQITTTRTPAASEVLVGASVQVDWTADTPIVGYSLLTDDQRDAEPAPAVSTPPATSTTTLTRSTAGEQYLHLRAVDQAGNWSETRTVPVAFRDGLVSSPAAALRLDGSVSTMNLTQTLAGSGTGYVCAQYRRPGSADWMVVPPANVTNGGSAIGSWPAAITKGSEQTLVWTSWAAASEIANNPGGIEVRTLAGTSTTACDPAAATVLATRDVFYQPPPASSGGGGGGGGGPTIGGPDDQGRILFSFEAWGTTHEDAARRLLLAAGDGGDRETLTDRAFVFAAAQSDDGRVTAIVDNAYCASDEDIRVSTDVSPELVASGGRVQSIALSSDGSQMAYAVQTPDEYDCSAGVGSGTIVVVDLVGSAAPRTITTAGLSPVFLHGGSVYDLCWVETQALLCLDLDASTATPLTVRTDVMAGGRVFWARDDQAVAYDAGTVEAPSVRIARNSAGVVGIAGSSATINDLADRTAGPWSPDGTLLATTRRTELPNTSIAYAIETVDPDTGQVAASLRSALYSEVSDWYNDLSSYAVDRARVFAWSSRLPNIAGLYRPYLEFDSDERWRPIDPASMLGETMSGSSVHRLCKAFSRTLTIRGGGQTAYRSNCDTIPQAPLAPAGFDDQLDASRAASVAAPAAGFAPVDPAVVALQTNGSGSSSHEDYFGSSFGPCGVLCDVDDKIFVNRVDQNDLVLLQYWFFYRFNDAKTVPLSFPVPDDMIQHQGDWEGVTVAISDGVVPRVAWVAYSQHSDWYRYYTGDLHSGGPAACVGG
jgi:hypothetical protein